VFPHPVYIVSTIKSRVYVIDRLDDSGVPAHAIRYELTNRDRALINAHDRYGAGEPGQLRLRVPRDPKGSPKRAASTLTGRYIESGTNSHGKGKRHHRPVTSGAKARFVAAVGAMSPSKAP
jgi:acyl dehydratase